MSGIDICLRVIVIERSKLPMPSMPANPKIPLEATIPQLPHLVSVQHQSSTEAIPYLEVAAASLTMEKSESQCDIEQDSRMQPATVAISIDQALPDSPNPGFDPVEEPKEPKLLAESIPLSSPQIIKRLLSSCRIKTALLLQLCCGAVCSSADVV